MVTSCCFYFAAIQQPTAIMTEAVMNVRVMGCRAGLQAVHHEDGRSDVEHHHRHRIGNVAPVQSLLRRRSSALVTNEHHHAHTDAGTQVKESRHHCGRNYLQHHLRYRRADGIEYSGKYGQK